MYFRTPLLFDNSTDVARRAGPDYAPTVKMGQASCLVCRRAGRKFASRVRCMIRPIAPRGCASAITRLGINTCNDRIPLNILNLHKPLQNKHLQRHAYPMGTAYFGGKALCKAFLNNDLRRADPQHWLVFWASKTAKQFRRCFMETTYDDRFWPDSGRRPGGGPETVDVTVLRKATCDCRAAAAFLTFSVWGERKRKAES